MYTMFLPLLQALDVSDVTSLISAKEFTVNGLLLVAIIMLWRRMTAAEEKIEVIRKEKDEGFEKYIPLLIENQRLIAENNKLIDENTKMFARLEKILDK